ncbi:MAG: toprim domain-containing protein [Firmicutes bacterium]|nr:toprim domain-containing protein [Bacillota bacterium]
MYGLELARANLRKHGHAVIVEGFMDVIGLYEAGFDNVVAALGTALTENQARLLKRFTKDVVIAFDGDAAGEIATWRGLEILRNQGLKVKVAQLPDGEDPDSFVRRFGSEAFQDLLTGAVGLTEFKLGTLIRRGDLASIDGKMETIGRIITILAEINSPIEQSEYLEWTAQQLDIRADLLAAELHAHTQKTSLENRARHRIATGSNNRKGRSARRAPSRSAASKQGTPGRPPRAGIQGLSAIEGTLLRLLLNERYLMERVAGVLEPGDFIHPVAQKAAEVLFACQEAGHLNTATAVFDFTEDPAVQRLVANLLDQKSSLPLPQTCMHYVRRLQVMQLREGLRRFEEQVEEAGPRPSKENLSVELDRLLIRFRQVREEIIREFSVSQ